MSRKQLQVAVIYMFISAVRTASTSTTVSTVGGSPVLCAEPRLLDGWVQSNGLDEFAPGAFVYLHCKDGYSIKYDNVPYPFIQVLCGADGQWHTPQGSDHMPICEEKPCSNPPRIASSSVQLIYNNETVDSSLSSHRPETRALYHCVKGYVLASETQTELVCDRGEWDGPHPRCNELPPASCKPLPRLANGLVELKLYEQPYTAQQDEPDKLPAGVKAYYQCHVGYELMGDPVRECENGLWTGSEASCKLPSSPGCPQPPILDHGDYSLDSREFETSDDQVAEGSQVFYYCHNGFQLEDENDADTLVCRSGIWQGQMPRCIRRQHCDVPTDIEFGNWVISGTGTTRVFSHYWLGTEIQYECDDGYEHYGSTTIVCQSSGYWSDNPPKCLPKALYCPEPDPVQHGYYVCNPNGCGRFKVGVEIYFECTQGYEPVGIVQQTCAQGGHWSNSQPVCLPVSTSTPAPAAAFNSLNGFNSNTVMVVTATSCSVLGLLIIVIVIVAVQRRQPSPALCHPVAPPPPTFPSAHTGSVDEHDRVALVAFADGVQAVLPTYEEATGSRSWRNRLIDAATPHRIAPGDYRPLPTIPPILRGRLVESQRPLPPVMANPASDSHRNSIITVASTATRDNLSLAFGSMDTMNISDGTSTTVTIDTMESTASNPSLALSQRAVAGSIGSSHGSLVDDDAPLLEADGPDETSSLEKSAEEKPVE